MSKLFSILKYGIATLAFGMEFLVLLLFMGLGWLRYENSKPFKKPSAIAGYAEATFFDAHLLLYPDSTYYYSRSSDQGNWIQSSDSIILHGTDSINAILVNLKPVEIRNPDYHWLNLMEIKEFNPPKVVTFPKPN